MKAIVQLYLRYLNLAVVSMLLATLGIILVAGIYASDEILQTTMGARNKALIPTVITILLSTVSLFAIGLVGIRRGKVLTKHPELKTKPFKDFYLFRFAFKNKILQALILILIPVTLGATTYTNKLLNNQAIVGAGIGYPGTFFNKSLIIEVTHILGDDNGSMPKVTAVIHSDGYPDSKIENQGVGYETTYTGRDRFIVRITEITEIYAKFFVERIED